MKTRLGHSCFCMEYREYSIVTDPYEDGYVPGLAPLCLSAGAVYCSHGHGDHSAAACVKQTREKAPPDFSVQEFAVPHDHHGGARRGMNTIRQFCFGSLRVVHMGDTGCVPEEITLAALHGCDALLLPIGGYYTVDAEEAFAICEEDRAALHRADALPRRGLPALMSSARSTHSPRFLPRRKYTS